MQVATSKEGAVTVLKPTGSIIAGELNELEQQLDNSYRNWTKRIVVNMSEVTYIDSGGLEMLLKFQRQLEERGMKLKLSGLNEITQKIFDLTRLSRSFEIFADTNGAVRSFL
jgi:anti-anti-sigma factor